MNKLLILLTVVLLTGLPAHASVPEQGDTNYKVAPKVPIKAHAFNLNDVRLLDGPFKKATDLDAKYLLSFDSDRLLSQLRETAGLKPKGKVYDGWEGLGLSGHMLVSYMFMYVLPNPYTT